MSSKNKTALITGASSGIGYEFAKLLAKDNYDLIIIGRNGQRLNSIKSELENEYKIIVTVYLKDLSELEETYEVYKNICDNNLDIEVLINCAGFGIYGEFYQTDYWKDLKMINVNIISLTYLTRVILSTMIKRNSGKILNVSSTAAFKPGPLMSVYFATKAYVLSFSEAVAVEIKNTGVTLTVLCPGATKTDFLTKASLDESQHFKYKKMLRPEEVALSGYNAMKKGRVMVIPGLMNRMFTFVIKFLPRMLVTNIMYKIKKRKSK